MKWAVLTALLLVSGAALGSPNARDMEDYCKTYSWANGHIKIQRDQDFQAGSCIGFMAATLDFLQYANSGTEKRACLPPGIDGDQLAKVFIKYLQTHPEYLTTQATGVIASAANEAFPCPAK